MKFIAPIVTIAISASYMITTSSVLAVNSNHVRRNVLRGNVERDLRIRRLEPSGEGEEESESLSDSLSESLSESEDESESLDSIEEEAIGESLVEVDSGEATGDGTVQELKLLDLESGTSGIPSIGVTDGEDEEADEAESVSEDESESLSESLSESEDEGESESLDSTEEEATGNSLVQVDSGEATTRESSAQTNLLDLQSEIDELQSEITDLESEITNTSGIVGTNENGAESESEDEGESLSESESEDESVSLDITDEEGNADGTLVRVIAGRVGRPSSARVNLLRFDSVTTNTTTNTSGIGVESESEDEGESLSESEDESQSSDEEGNVDGVVQVDGVDLVQMNLLDYQSGATNMSGKGLTFAFLGILITGIFQLI